MAKQKPTTTTPAPHPTDPANNDQKLVKLANEAMMHDLWGIEFGERGEAMAHLSKQIFPGRYLGGGDDDNGWLRWQQEHEAQEGTAIAEMTMTPAASVAGIAVKLRLLERDTEFWHTADSTIDLFRSALDDAERLAREGGVS